MHRQSPVVVPAIIASEWDELVADIMTVAPTAHRVQIDVMDGELVPSRSFPYNTTTLEGRTFPTEGDAVYGVHLMTRDPRAIGEAFIRAGARTIVAQIEGFRQGAAPAVLEAWRQQGAEVGVSLMLDTPLAEVASLIEQGDVSVVQVMSIARVGFQGEAFDPRAFARIAELHTQYPDVTIAVDGGVDEENLGTLAEAGATRFGIGSAIMSSEDPAATVYRLQHLLNSYAL